MNPTLPIVLGAGLIDSVNPCAIGVLLMYLALFFTIQASRGTLLLFGTFYIAAMYVTYLLIGLGFLSAFHLFGVHNFFGWVAAILVIIVGLFQIKEYFWPAWQIPILSPLLARCRIPKWNREFTVLGALTLGVLVGLCEFPCSGGIYLATVSFLGARETFWTGLSYLLLYNLMFILPLVVLFAISVNKRVVDRVRAIQAVSTTKVKLGMGIMMIVMGAALIAWLINPYVG
jgi:cytochrome c biogenesis protein CcdA